jgi:hypothetical protein
MEAMLHSFPGLGSSRSEANQRQTGHYQAICSTGVETEQKVATTQDLPSHPNKLLKISHG